jgi:hypothetical protein
MLKKISKNIELFTGRTTDEAFKRITMSASDGIMRIYGYDGYGYVWLKFKTSSQFPTLHMDINEFTAAVENSKDMHTTVSIHKNIITLSSGNITSSINADVEEELYEIEPPEKLIGRINSKSLHRILDLGSMCADKTSTEENLIMLSASKNFYASNGMYGNMNSFAGCIGDTLDSVAFFIPYNTVRHMVKVLANMKEIDLNISSEGNRISIFSDSFGFTFDGITDEELYKTHAEMIGKSKDTAMKGKVVELNKEQMHNSLDSAIKIMRTTGGTFIIDMDEEIAINARTPNGSTTKIDVCNSNLKGGEFYVNIEMLRSFIKRIDASKYRLMYKNDTLVVMDGTIKEMLMILR